MQESIQIPEMTLELDRENYPQITTRYSTDQLKQILFQMCLKANLPITEASMYSQAACLESDLAEMFG